MAATFVLTRFAAPLRGGLTSEADVLSFRGRRNRRSRIRKNSEPANISGIGILANSATASATGQFYAVARRPSNGWKSLAELLRWGGPTGG
jgi:hypothetical protein